ncbi:MAG: tetratricopeptide repeat protein [Cyanobacteria bacterium J06656_5]
MASAFNEAVAHYEKTLATLEAADELSHEQIITTLLARNRLQNQIIWSDSIDSAVLVKIIELDQALHFKGIRIHNSINLAQLRLSYRPKKEYWWWFLDTINQEPEVASSISLYELAIDSMEKGKQNYNHPNWVVENLTEVLVCRDNIQTDLDNGSFSAKEIGIVAALDERLRKLNKNLLQEIDAKTAELIATQLEKSRDVLNPSSEAWWWFQKLSRNWWDRYDPVWTVLTIFWLTGTFGLLTDISTRFLGGSNPGTFGSIAIIFQSILALIGGGSVTQKGQATIDQALTQWNIPKRFWQAAKFGSASLLLLLFIGFRLSLPKIAIRYNDSAIQDYLIGDLDGAESKLKRALELDPSYARAHYNLGVVYQTLGNEQKSQEQYNLAVAGNFIPAYNNQARLLILEEDYPNAVNLLEKGLALAKKNDTDQDPKNDTNPVIEHDLWKNLGWARYLQGYYTDAEESLKIAIELANNTKDLPQEAAPHCLLAQTYEELDTKSKAKNAWEGCSKFAKNPDNPEEDVWQKEAYKQLNR